MSDPLEVRPDHAERDGHTHRISIVLSEEQATAMAGGYVPNSVKGILRELLDYELEDLRRAERPVTKRTKRA